MIITPDIPPFSTLQKESNAWRRLLSNAHQEFQNILSIILEFDEKTGKDTEYLDSDRYLIRKALTRAEPETLNIYVQLQPGETYTYHVVCESKGIGYYIATSWIHEDGIRYERDRCDEDHPVFNLVCLSDLYKDSILCNELPDIIHDIIVTNV